MAKPATVKIKLVSTADTGFYYVTKKIPATTRKNSLSANMIRLRVSTWNSRKPRSSKAGWSYFFKLNHGNALGSVMVQCPECNTGA